MSGAEDVWTISTCLRDVSHNREGHQVITWHVRATSDYGSVADLDAAWKAALGQLMPLLCASVQAEGAFYKRWLPSPTTAVGIKWTPPVPGETDALSLPLASCALVLRQSGQAGRQSWGRVYIPWLPVQYADEALPNRLVEISRLGLEQACLDVDSALQAGATGTNWRTVTVSRRSLANPGIWITPVTHFTCMNEFRSLAQRGRRHYICPFEDRWMIVTPWASFARRKSEGGSWSNNGSNALGWKYWLDNGARGGDDGPVDPAWTSPTFTPTGWHTGISRIHPARRVCPYAAGPGGVTWPIQIANPDANDPPAYDSGTAGHYLRSPAGVPSAASPLINSGELDYYRCTFKVQSVPLVRSAMLRINWLDGCAHYINGVEVWNNLGAFDSTPPACREGEEIDILPHLIYENQPNCWAVIHQPFGELGTSRRWWDRYLDHRPPNQDPYDSWWSGEIRIGGTVD